MTLNKNMTLIAQTAGTVDTWFVHGARMNSGCLPTKITIQLGRRRRSNNEDLRAIECVNNYYQMMVADSQTIAM